MYYDIWKGKGFTEMGSPEPTEPELLGGAIGTSFKDACYVFVSKNKLLKHYDIDNNSIYWIGNLYASKSEAMIEFK